MDELSVIDLADDDDDDERSYTSFNSVCFNGEMHDLSVTLFNSKTRNFERCYKLNTIDLTNDDPDCSPTITDTTINTTSINNITNSPFAQSLHSDLSYE